MSCRSIADGLAGSSRPVGWYRQAASIVFVLLVAALLGACRSDSAPLLDARLDYVEVDSTKTADGTPLPLLIAIHGLGDNPEAFCDFMKGGVSVPARIVCPRAPNAYGRGFSWFPPMSALGTAQRLADALGEAAELVAELTRVLSPAPSLLGEPVLTGYSQGGMTSYYLAFSDAELFAAAVPIAGMLPAPLRAEIRADDEIPLYAFHGEADELVPFSEAERTAEAFKEHWPETEFSTYEGVGHRMSAKMRDDIFSRLNELLRLEGGGA
jgi:phospholipase/carboxylesterase